MLFFCTKKRFRKVQLSPSHAVFKTIKVIMNPTWLDGEGIRLFRAQAHLHGHNVVECERRVQSADFLMQLKSNKAEDS